MASTFLDLGDFDGDERDSRLGGQMSFLAHLDELCRRLVRSVVFLPCWFVSDYIYMMRKCLGFAVRPWRRSNPV